MLALIATVALTWSSSLSSSADPTTTPKDQNAPADVSAQRAGVVAGRHGTGRTFRGQWYGTWRFGAKEGFCIEFDAGHPTSKGTRNAPGQLPRLSKSASTRVKYIVANYGLTRNKDDAAAAAIAVWKLQGLKRFSTYYSKMVKAKAIPKAIQRRASAILNESKNFGPYKLSMTLTSALPGQIVSGTVTVRAANNTVMPSRAVSLTTTNASIVSRSARTNARGTYAFRARVNGTGQIRVGAKLVFNSLRALWMNDPTPGHQRIVMAGGVKDSASAFRSSVRSFNGARLSNGCDGECNGVAPLTAVMKNECGSKPMTQFIYVDGKWAGQMSAKACQTVRMGFKAKDASKVTTTYCYTDTYKGACRTARQTGPALTAECPPMVTFRYEANCNCEASKQFTFTLVGPKQATKRTYTAVLDISGQKSQTLTLTGNGTKTFQQVTAPKGTRLKLTAKVLGKSFVLDDITVG